MLAALRRTAVEQPAALFNTPKSLRELYSVGDAVGLCVGEAVGEAVMSKHSPPYAW